jgi:hypothetical protein
MHQTFIVEDRRPIYDVEYSQVASAAICRVGGWWSSSAWARGNIPEPNVRHTRTERQSRTQLKKSMQYRLTTLLTLVLCGRRPVLLSATILSLGLVLGIQVTGSVVGAWRWIGVPSTDWTFADTRFITQSIECMENGHDPYLDPRCDPFGRPYNYPPIWLELSRLSVRPATTKLIGIVIAASTFGALALILSSGLAASGALIVLSLLSPPILFGLERGNIDFVIFTLLVLGIVATSSKPPRARTGLRALIIVALAVLKIYPLAAAGVFLRNGRGWFLSIMVAATAGGAFVWAAYGRVGLIMANTPMDYMYSFGAATLFLPLRAAEERFLPSPTGDSSSIRLIASVIAMGWALILLLGCLYFSRLPHVFKGLLPVLRRGETAADTAVACLSVFVFCFLLGANYDYRLIFLLGAMPVMLQHFESRPGVRTLLAPVAVVTLLWLSRPDWYYFDALLDWLAFSGAVAWLAANLLSARRSASSIESTPGAAQA